MTVNELKRINADAETRQILELREKEAHDKATALAEARQEGKQEERLAIARVLLAKGIEPAVVAEATGLPLETIRSLNHQPA